jgi:hypothetical protein
MLEALPSRFAQEADPFDGSVTFERTGIVVQDRARSWRGNQSKMAFASGGITAAPIIGAVPDDFPGGDMASLQEGPEGLGVVGLAWGDYTCDNQGRGGIDAEMNLAVGASL